MGAAAKLAFAVFLISCSSGRCMESGAAGLLLAAAAAAAWLVAAPPQGQVRRGSRSGRRRCPAPGPGLPLAPLRSRRRGSRRAEERG